MCQRIPGYAQTGRVVVQLASDSDGNARRKAGTRCADVVKSSVSTLELLIKPS